jgi:osmotically-inducible protein OsmY
MKTDAELQKDVTEELEWDPRIVDGDIGISVHGGVVTLTGSVPSFAQKLAAIEAVQRVAGVRAVAPELAVRIHMATAQSDTDLAHQILNTFAWDIEVAHEKIEARVEQGWVTLEGEVDWEFQRSAAERVVRYLIGVKGVSNLLTIKGRVFRDDVGQHIKDALLRSADADSRRIQITAAGGTVTLAGTVRSWAEKADAKRAAWSTSGVTKVDDRLAIIT